MMQQPDTKGITDAGSDKQFWIEEYKSTCDRFQRYLDAYLKSLLMYLGVNAILLKFALDETSTPQLRLVMCICGLAFCGWAYVTVAYANRLLTILSQKRSTAVDKIGLDVISDFISAKWTSLLLIGVVTLILAGWLLVLFIY